MRHSILYLAITNHGFGHATRAAAIAAEIQRLNSEIVLILATTAPRSVLEAYIPGDFIHRPRAFDVGVVQHDSLTMDKEATLEKLKQIRKQQRSLIASEVTFLKQNRVGLVLGDIPPLAAPMAKAAGIPGWMMGNFGWDFIYRDWGGEFIEMSEWIGECFSQCDRVFRMPFHESMSAFPHIEDVGLTGVNPRVDAAELSSKFALEKTPKEKIVLMTFGGLGLDRIPYENVQHFPDWTFICFDLAAPDFPNLIRVDDRFYRPIDFMPLSGRLISKPGYSTFSEACRFDVPIISLTREGFAEAPILLEGIQAYAEHQIITPQAFFKGDWSFLNQPMTSPRQPERLAKDGNRAIAQAVIDYFETL
ncbi:glycosyl transferase [Myxacorys almedinensis]|uniref:Glycosyl transferase n=1 Tax=Myxacorys almedinensis A TaxID=2690445 RepID=A0A8J7Z216_9CYAN|nr:glycosyl transferase [Myxacorys almedinensis]NDJ18607.1 glycosyl transferase [Myxacorys almedinensis A]